MPWRGEQLADGRFLGNTARIQHDNTLGDARDHAHIVGDEHHRHPGLFPQPGQQVENLGLDRDVERGRGLVGDEELRLARDAIAIMARCRMPPESWCG